MDEQDKDKLRLALSIFSGRVVPIQLSSIDLEILGFDYYAMVEFGRVRDDAVLKAVENVMLELLCKLSDDLEANQDESEPQ